MQLELFCTSTILCYKHSYSPTGTQIQTPAISYYFDKVCNNSLWPQWTDLGLYMYVNNDHIAQLLALS